MSDKTNPGSSQPAAGEAQAPGGPARETKEPDTPKTVWDRLGAQLRRLDEKLSTLTLLGILDQLEKLSVLVVVIFWFAGCHERKVQSHFQAWQVVNSAHGGGGDGGRLDALQKLNHDGVSLARVRLDSAFLSHVNLAGARLEKASLVGAFLDSAQLAGARLRGASAQGATFNASDLSETELTGARMDSAKAVGATFSGAVAVGADFTGATLRRAVFRDAALTGANLSGADLSGTDLAGAALSGADLSGALLSNVRNWSEIRTWSGARLHDVRDPPAGFMEFALLHGAVRQE